MSQYTKNAENPEEAQLADLVKSLGERVRILEDIQELGRLRAELPRRINDEQWDRVADLFAQDSHLDYAHLGQAAGKDAIHAYFSALPGLIQQDRPGSRLLVKQFLHAHDVQVHGDRATGVSFFEERVVFDDDSAMVAGKFTDTYVRENGTWLFSRIELTLYWVLPHPAGLSAQDGAAA
ncbi:nuclear transport factor 2 family protein [Streptomyces kunmingensis]|uniref:Nuclear transport factor 2 family protein n=1 Tax=Streptomyces kunmingensis TaxID=68225 RepID=A0ABU6CLH2_9ACTN|nr:nuclear transport factor 2 family protein [Streptomyces kunmingensis]MEB3964801.1 nuclear transport factor 2 family protein [Streptomyces kunmingensis]